jgi:hypothetical protein
MVVAPDHAPSTLSHAGSVSAALDARLFSLIEELKKCEKRRDELLDRLATQQGEQIEAAAKKACDAARSIYERIAAIKPTTRAGVLRQLELAARGWVAPWTVPIAMAALREIADRPPPFKMGSLPPVRAEIGIESNSAMRETAPMPLENPRAYCASGDIATHTSAARHQAGPGIARASALSRLHAVRGSVA